MSTPAIRDDSYINSISYEDHEHQLKTLRSVMDDMYRQSTGERKLRYADVDVEGERSANKLAPDELYIPQHIIDSNIRREQSSYVQYVVQSPRAVVMEDSQNIGTDTTVIEKDVTKRLRYDGWQLQMFACIDSFQQCGYGIMEVVMDPTKPGEVAHEFVAKCDFGFVADTKDIQEAELIGRNYFFTKTTLLNFCLPEEGGGRNFNFEQVQKVVGTEPQVTEATAADSRDKSLYTIQKIMFRVGGIVYVAWACENRCDDWLREPRPLFIGRKKQVQMPAAVQPSMNPLAGGMAIQPPQMQSQDAYETEYPYVLFPYLISENNTISQLRGRVFLDQDTQEAASSLLSSFVTAHRRAAGLYFSKEVDDPNDDVLQQKNVFFTQGALINSKIKQFQLVAPGSDLLAALQSLVTANQAQQSQIDFAAMNRRDSRKTATEISAASQASQALSTVQVVLFSNSIRQIYNKMFDIIQSRIIAGLIQVSEQVRPMYNLKYTIKPAGDIDVVQRQQDIQAMMNAWPVYQATPIAQSFLMKLTLKMFPEDGPAFVQEMQAAIQQQQQQAASQQAQMMQAAMNIAMQIGAGIINLDQHPEYWSETGQIHAKPAIEDAATKVKAFQKQMQQNQQQKQLPTQ